MNSGAMRLNCWEGYERAEFLKAFEAEYNVQISAQPLVTDYSAAYECASSETLKPDILNINNPWIREYLDPMGVIQSLDDTAFSQSDATIHPDYSHLAAWSRSRDGSRRLGIAQRFGAFNLVINTARISRETAEAEGFSLAQEANFKNRYGILLYRDFNLFHIAFAAGLNPFQKLDSDAMSRFESMAQNWFSGAKVLSEDHFPLNRQLIDGDIDFYLSGGTYTASPARLAGYTNICAVTPRNGPVGGKGGIVFTEITSLLARSDRNLQGEKFLQWMLTPETAYRAATAPRTLNPVLQMGSPSVMNQFSNAELDAIQWDTLAEDVSHCVEYDLLPDHGALVTVLESEIKNHQHLIVENQT